MADESPEVYLYVDEQNEQIKLNVPINMGLSRILQVDDPIDDYDAVNKQYVGLLSNLWSVNDPDIYYNLGNVGIGTNTPSTELEIVHAGASAGGVKISSDQNNKYLILGGDIPYIASGNSSLYINYYGNDTIVNVGAGRLSVGGTPSGAYVFQVFGQTYMSNAIVMRSSQANNFSGSSITFQRSGNSTGATGPTLDNGEVGYLDFASYDGISAYRRTALILAIAAGNTTPTSSGGQLLFYTTPSGSTSAVERARITSDGTFQTVNSIYMAENTTSILKLGRYDAGYPYALIESVSSGAGMSFRTGSTDRLVISNDGKLGLGGSWSTYFSQKVQLLGGNALILAGTDDVDYQAISICKNDTLDSNNIMWYLRHASNNKDFYVVSFDGTGGGTTNNWMKFDFVNSRIQLMDETFSLNTSGYIYGGTTAYALLSTSVGSAIGYDDSSWSIVSDEIRGTANNILSVKAVSDGTFHIMKSMMIEEIADTPSNPTQSNQSRIYLKGDKLIIQFNDGGTVRYKYLDLTGTGVTWTHTTSAP